MKKTALLFCALTVLTACLPPRDVSEADLAAFDAAVASIGCDLVSEEDYLPVELQTGLPREKVIEVAQYRVDLRQAVPLSNGGVRLTTGACAPEPAAEPVVTAAAG